MPSPRPQRSPNPFRSVYAGQDASYSGNLLCMSASAMLEARISIGQLVLVSLLLDPSQLDQSQMPGESCAVGVAWPSKKLLKNDVRMSKQLAQALGFPAVGSNLQVTALQVKCGQADIAKQLHIQPCMGTDADVVVQECRSLSLEFSGGFRPPPVQQTTDDLSTPTKASSRLKSRGAATPATPATPSTPATPWTPAMKGAIDAERVTLVAERYLESGSQEMKELVEKLAASWLYGRLLLLGSMVVIPISGADCGFSVKAAESLVHESAADEEGTRLRLEQLSIEGSSALTVFYISNRTLVHMRPIQKDDSAEKETVDSPPEFGGSLQPAEHLYSSLGGLSEEVEALKEIVDHSLLRPELLESFGLKQTKGVLLYGPPGTGKTTLAQAVAFEAGVKMFVINGPEILSEYYGESEAALKRVFDTAAKHQPAVVFIDELDAITPERKHGGEELGQRLMATLLTLMDTVHLNKILVIAATNRRESIDTALRRHGRFDHEIEIGVPAPSGRLEILQVHLRRMNHSLSPEEVQALAAATHGFVGADLYALCNEAALEALRRHVASKSDDAVISTLCVTTADLWLAKTKIRPSAMREVILEVPKVRWSDIGGQDEVKQQIKEIVEWPQKHQDSFTRIGATPPRGVLLYGPPGCSKTLMARAVASETGLNFIAVKGPELFSKWVGESEKAVRALFARAKAASPSVVFFDEIDGLAVPRGSHSGEGVSVEDRVMSQLLIELDGVSPRNGVSVIAATNRPDKLDPALLRPGRFDRKIYVGPPDKRAREQIFRIHLKRAPCSNDVAIEELAFRTESYTGADITAVCREAALAALEETLEADLIHMSHFHAALERVLPSRYDESVFNKFRRG